jgi:hypothetical protein
MSSRRLPRFLPVLLAVLTGCAASQPALRPADLPEHTVESPIVLHWRIDRAPDRATAFGLVEIPQNPDRVDMVMVELQGIDGQGRITNRARDLVSSRSFTNAEPWPFTVSIKSTGAEERFVVRVAEIGWRKQMTGR